MTTPRHFLDLHKVETRTLRKILRYAQSYKAGLNPIGGNTPLKGKTLALIFEKPSTRTRVSFEVGMMQLGGQTVVLQGSDSQIGRGETIGDTAKVLSRYVDGIMIRTDDPAKLTELAEEATVPVINGLTDDSHPCQVMADVLTFEEHRGPIDGRKIAWVGDGNNMATSWIHAGERFGFELVLACPEELAPNAKAVAWAQEQGAKVSVETDPAKAVRGAAMVTTDTWVSMGDTDAERRIKLLTPYQVNDALMDAAGTDAIFMHCLPAHREEEVTASVMDGPRSVVWDEAENRLHAQKGILAWAMN